MSKLRNLNRQFISNLKTHETVTNAKRNLILSILKSTTTKREARNYLNKYQNQFDFSDITFNNGVPSNSLEKRDSQRELFINRFLNKQNPFTNIYDDETKLQKIPLRLALFKIKFQSISLENWKGMAETFKRLIHLGISPIIMLDYDHLPANTFRNNELYMLNQTNKIMNILGKPTEENDLKTIIMRSLFTKKTINDKDLAIDNLESVLIPLYQGVIPIIQPIVYNASTCMQEFIDSNDLLFSLCSSLLTTKNVLSIEKVVMIDPIGGIPSIERNQTSHVFINLSQEYSDIVSELYIGFIKPEYRIFHMNNLKAMNKTLTLVSDKTGNDETTGIITTPDIMSVNNDQLNPIIYNVLTDRSIISSSLPTSHNRTPELSTSILKKGVDVNILDALNYPKAFTLNNLVQDGSVNKSKLVDLIDDSFGKKLDTEKYFDRINDSLATVVIVGDYDGAAIITWETCSKTNEKIAYLDKFAIASVNQGLPGLADIIFKIILQSHPNELIWRSRKNNPVNKWYFERCCGTLSNPGSQWKIFYTGDIFNKKIDKLKKQGIPGGVNIHGKMHQYSDITENIPPSFL
ncbi:DEHA2A04708p [Debaryomyces hansenii CBS767]|uniref:Amino-acid acetyltransferase, mitochondrial n=1 Tax=Debaryomyces hansenii (strain ATCC 36239 / CBS 767 / BCRC 21394 / JCM 1990 / NBRC 0083 / IGC 2968) TaxID=284592 RepID=NAGS_DEBHA|nr:DEHA2A04708p [Debaryomyces hansenii CBS767]Q6BZ43.2 RecName: Full=Amino-acid acetyltransferase, mitochondrial; AltName: Full=Arginine-requiring protein 2; AltName: Full=Glutamate N-acetyltransferase; AltName: Full=N-acetylglutamate synthase; Short=AGS; Short=NAGS; Flags: Precursor [Debaryomyces hansenii CBS767]CAG84481.2 DEHA2A04708p [Debaryomyces hansenii CBS767]|eukprot:XP_456526.2 DEHA2A04708p [Debaryomyces hansenii CBS767]